MKSTKTQIIRTSTILNDIFKPRIAEFFGLCNVTYDIKDGKFIATIDNMKSDINVSIDMYDVAKYYGFKKWEIVKSDDIDESRVELVHLRDKISKDKNNE